MDDKKAKGMGRFTYRCTSPSKVADKKLEKKLTIVNANLDVRIVDVDAEKQEKFHQNCKFSKGILLAKNRALSLFEEAGHPFWSQKIANCSKRSGPDFLTVTLP